jgi:hypothetical protein
MERPAQDEDEGAIGYRNVDEEADHDERGGTQGPGLGEPPPDEERTGDEPDGVAGGG